MSNKELEDIEEIKADLKYQLTFEHMDWTYFIDTAKKAMKIAEKINVNFKE